MQGAKIHFVNQAFFYNTRFVQSEFRGSLFQSQLIIQAQ
jgi:hypothetical protein